MRLKVEIRYGDEKKDFVLSGSMEYSVGRANCSLTILDNKCSKKHLILALGENDKLVAKDQNSTNGTFLKGKKITNAELDIGDELRLGNSLITIKEFSKSTVMSNKSEGDEMVVLHSFPDAYRALKKSKLRGFVDYIDEKDKKKSQRLISLVKVDKKSKKSG